MIVTTPRSGDNDYDNGSVAYDGDNDVIYVDEDDCRHQHYQTGRGAEARRREAPGGFHIMMCNTYRVAYAYGDCYVGDDHDEGNDDGEDDYRAHLRDRALLVNSSSSMI